MTISYTGNLKLALPTTGTEAGTWGDVVNQQITSLLDQSVAGTVSLTAMTNADYTLTSGNGSTANEARYMALLVPVTLTLTGARNIIVPTSSKAYIIRNLSTGGFAVTLKTSGGTGISVPNGKTMALYCDGTNVIDGTDYLASLTLGTALPVLSGGTGVTTSTGTGSVVLNTSPTLITPALGTPTALVGTNITGTAAGLTAGNVTTNANLTGAVTSTGNATLLGSFTSLQLSTALTDETGSGAAVFANSPTLVTPILGTPQSATLTNATGLPISTGVSGLGTGVATALAVNVGTAGAPVVNGGVLGTPSSGTVTNLTGTASININGTVGATTPTTGAFTTLAASGAIKTTGANLVNEASATKLSQEGIALSRISAYGNDASTQGSLQIRTVSSDGTASTIPAVISSTGLAVTGTLSATGAVTLSGGTANGVAYLNGSKVLTTGSALTFDGASLTVGTSAGAGQHILRTYTNAPGFAAIYNGGVTPGGSNYSFITTATQTTLNATTFVSIELGGAEQMRLTSTGLGIGTNSPAAKLDVAGTFNGTQAVFGNTSGRGLLIGTALNGGVNEGSTVLNARGAGNGQFLFQTDGTTRATISDSGNLGLGVTPSASPACVNLELPNGSTLSSRSVVPQFAMMTNAVGDWYGATYKTTAPANMYLLSTGQHNWYNAPSGTAGAVITFTQAMTLDASGNLGIGTTAPAYKLDVLSGADVAIRARTSNSNVVEIVESAGTSISLFRFINTVANNVYVGADSSSFIVSTGGTERMRLDSSGNLGIGTSSPISKLQANKASQTPGGAVPSGALIISNSVAGNGCLEIGNDSSANSWLQSRNTTTASYYDLLLNPSGGNLGIGTTSPLVKLHVSTSGNTPIIGETTGGATSYLNLRNTGGQAYVAASTNDLLFALTAGATEGMRLTSTGLGIGTSSPSFPLDISVAAPRIRQTATTGTNSVLLQLVNTGGTAYVGLDSSSGGLGGAYSLNFFHGGAYPIVFSTSGTERMRLDASGNLGLGVTPSAWSGGYKALQIAQGMSLWSANGAGAQYSSNVYYDGAVRRYVYTGTAMEYQQSGGLHSWSTAPSGTAGNAITFTQAMTLTAAGELLVGRTGSSGLGKLNVEGGADFTGGNVLLCRDTGNVGIGTSSPGAKLDVAGNALLSGGGGYKYLYFNSATESVTVRGAKIGKNYDSPFDLGIWASTHSAGNATATVFYRDLTTESMRLDSSGNLGLGVTPSAWAGRALQLQYGASLYSLSDYRAVVGSNVYYDGTNLRYLNTFFASQYTQVSGQHIWLNAPSGTAGNAITFTQAMTLDASGNLLVGTTSFASSNSYNVMLSASQGAGYFQHSGAAASGSTYCQFNYAGTNIGSITQSGTTAVLYNTTSDQRLKENIQDAAPASALIDAIQVRQFDWKSDGSHQRYGMVAQELYEVAPEAVHKPADPEDMMAVDYSKLVPLLIKEIQSLRARVAQLESKP